jgi:hypothetical protein
MGLYASSWTDYRKIRLAALLALPIVLLSPLVLAPISLRLFGSLTPAFPVAVLLILGAAYCEWRFYTWQCPRCGEPFGIFRSVCRSCSLERWSDDENAASDQR